MDQLHPLRPKLTNGVEDYNVSRWTSVPARRNTGMACSFCREKRTKCSGHKPSCTNCMKLGKRCSYVNTDRRRTGAWKDIVEGLQKRNERLERIIESLTCNSNPEAIIRLKQLREDRSLLSQDMGLLMQEPSDGSSDNDHLTTPTAVLPSQPSFLADHHLPSKSSSDAGSHGRSASVFNIDHNDLPPEHLTRRAVSTFVSCTENWLYITSSEACERLVRNVYYPVADAPQSPQICELSAIASVGSQYSTDGIQDSLKQNYFNNAYTRLIDVVEGDTITSLRVFVCLSLYLNIDKSTSARAMIASGLNIAWWRAQSQMQNTSSDPQERLELAKLLRSLAFMECWMSFTLGYMYDLRVEEMRTLKDLEASEPPADPCSVSDAILVQSQMYKVVLLSARIQSQVKSDTCSPTSELQRLSSELDTWYVELPETLHLRSLFSAVTSDPAFVVANRPPLLMHMLYIDARITLYERIIRLSLAQQKDAPDSTARGMFNLPEDIHQTYADYALQVARIVSILYEEENRFTRCWIIIHPSFHSSLILLLRTCQHLASGASHRLVMENLSYVSVCFRVLGTCREHDVSALRLFDVITPLYQRVRQIIDNAADMADSLRNDIDDSATAPVQIADITRRLTDAMATHFQEIWV